MIDIQSIKLLMAGRAGVYGLLADIFTAPADMEMIYNRIDRLNENDVLIVIDSSMKVQNMFEMSMNRSYLLNFERLKNAKFKCFYLGNSNCDEYFGFKNIKLKEENPLLINLLVFEIIKRIKKKGY